MDWIAAIATMVGLSVPFQVMTLTGSDYDIEADAVDDGYDANDKVTAIEKPPYEVDQKIYSPKDIDAAQVRLVNEVKDVLGQPPESTTILLRHFHWNRETLIEQYMERQQTVLEAAGLGDDVANDHRIKPVSGFICDICCDDDDPMYTFAMRCGHRYCVGCYTQYLNSKIKDEGEAARIKCPGDDCNRIVDSKSIEMLLAPSLKPR